MDLKGPSWTSRGSICGRRERENRWLTGHRLRNIRKQINHRCRLVLHGTNDFSPELIKQCIDAGVSKLNVNKLVLAPWEQHRAASGHKSLTQAMKEGIDILTKETERWMDLVGSSGRGIV